MTQNNEQAQVSVAERLGAFRQVVAEAATPDDGLTLKEQRELLDALAAAMKERDKAKADWVALGNELIGEQPLLAECNDLEEARDKAIAERDQAQQSQARLRSLLPKIVEAAKEAGYWSSTTETNPHRLTAEAKLAAALSEATPKEDADAVRM